MAIILAKGRARLFRFLGIRRDIGEDMGVLGGLHPPNTPIFLPHTGVSREPLSLGLPGPTPMVGRGGDGINGTQALV